VSVGILIITGSMKIFETVQQLTGGGPTHYSETLVTYAYNTTFARGEYGYGMALATATFLISLILMGIYTLLLRGKD
jgi:raffinose/stachyose/melibiose transport system permease protein